MGEDAHPNELWAVAKANRVLVSLEGNGVKKEWIECVQSDVRAFSIAGTGKRRR